MARTFDAARRTALVAQTLELMRTRGLGRLTMSELATALGLPRPTVSKHLAVLRRAGVVEDQVLVDDARGRSIALRPQPFAAVKRWLTEVEAFWTDELAAFKRHAERPRSK